MIVAKNMNRSATLKESMKIIHNPTQAKCLKLSERYDEIDENMFRTKTKKPKKGSKQAQLGKKKIDELREQNSEKQKKSKEDLMESKLKFIKSSSSMTYDEAEKKLEELANGCESKGLHSLAVEGRIALLKKMFVDGQSDSKKFACIQQILRTCDPKLFSRKQLLSLQEYATELGFSGEKLHISSVKYFTDLAKAIANSDVKSSQVLRSKKIVEQSSVRYQLSEMGYMLRKPGGLLKDSR